MSKKNISKISLWILIFSILSLVTVAMVWSPRKELKIRGNEIGRASCRERV